MSTAPPPIQNPGDRCPNCGAYRPAGQAYCANCGFSRPTAGPNQGAQIVWIVLFILVGLPAGCLGGCFVLIGLSAPTNANDWPFWLAAVGGVAISVALLTMMILSFRKKR